MVNATCDICFKVYGNRPTLRRHMVRVHKVEKVDDLVPLSYKSTFKCQETDCSFESKHSYQLILHLQNKHQLKFDIGDILFDTELEFETWKKNLENDTSSLFVKSSGVKKTSGNQKVYYRCHRAGFYKPTVEPGDEARKRKLKKQGSYKQNAPCTAYIHLTRVNGKLNVSFCKTHYQHTPTETRYLPLEESLRLIVVQKLSEGLPIEMIREDLMNSAPETEVPKVLRLTKKEKYNLVAEYNITKRPETDNGASLESWVVDMSTLGVDSPVKVFKPKGVESPELHLTEDDLCLISMTSAQCEFLWQFGSRNGVCIDSTIGLCVGHLEITSLFVVDDQGGAFPVAFMVSNRHDVQVMTLFFETIREAVGVFTAQSFMSGDTEVYYLAWSQVMGEVSRKYLSVWYVEVALRQALTKIKNKENQQEAFKMVRDLIYLQNEAEFCQSLTSVVSALLANADTKDYGQHFQENYAGRTELWAFCYRSAFHPSTNSSLERLHSSLRVLYLNGKKEKRLDKTITNLIKVFRDKVMERDKNIFAGKVKDRIATIKSMHELSVQSKFVIQKTSDKSWKIKPSEDSTVFFEIEDQESPPCCEFKCAECKVCTHMFTCTCPHSLMRSTICEHIHSLIKWLKTNQPTYVVGFPETKKRKVVPLLPKMAIRNPKELSVFRPLAPKHSSHLATPEIPMLSDPANLRNPTATEKRRLYLDLSECLTLAKRVMDNNKFREVQRHVQSLLSLLEAPSSPGSKATKSSPRLRAKRKHAEANAIAQENNSMQSDEDTVECEVTVITPPDDHCSLLQNENVNLSVKKVVHTYSRSFVSVSDGASQEAEVICPDVFVSKNNEASSEVAVQKSVIQEKETS